MKSEFSIKINLTLSKLVGTLMVLVGLYGFVTKLDPGHSVTLVITGAAAIGIKQYFLSKENGKG